MNKFLILALGGGVAYLYFIKKQAGQPTSPYGVAPTYNPSQPSQKYPWLPTAAPRTDNVNQPWYNGSKASTAGPADSLSGILSASTNVIHSLADVFGNMTAGDLNDDPKANLQSADSIPQNSTYIAGNGVDQSNTVGSLTAGVFPGDFSSAYEPSYDSTNQWDYDPGYQGVA